uniref:Protein argonaute 4A-like n=1 Tax=Nicotiana tabacum TaxID=4097 RepID=A0A1S3Y1K2_TOBAC
GYLIVHPSFHKVRGNFVYLGGRDVGCRDASTPCITRPGTVIRFLLAKMNADSLEQIDWAKRMLKGLRIKADHLKLEYKITDLSAEICRMQDFKMKPKGGKEEAKEVTVYEYFTKHRSIAVTISGDIPCINVGKQHPLCSLVENQRYTKAIRTCNYKGDALLQSAKISISDEFSKVKGRILPSPQKLAKPITLKRWAVVDFSNHSGVAKLCEDLQRCGLNLGITFGTPFVHIFEEDLEFKNDPAPVSFEGMIEKLKSAYLEDLPQFLLCILPQRKKSDLYAGCINSLLTMVLDPSAHQIPTMIIGMYVSPGPANLPAIAAVVSSRQGPFISCYKAVVRTLPPNLEVIQCLSENVTIARDEGLFRDVAREEDKTVLNLELDQIKKV